MEISELVSQLRLPPAGARPGLPPELRVGQILQAVAKGIAADGLLRLQVGQSELLAQSRVSLQPGQTLTLQVEKAAPIPTLRVIEAPTPQMVTAAALKQALPKMLALAPALGRLLQLGGDGQGAQLAPETRQLIRQLADALPVPREVATADGLRQAVSRSGLFHEAELLRNGQPAEDLKSALQRVALRLRNGPAPQARQGYAAPPTDRGQPRPTAGPPSARPATPGAPGSGSGTGVQPSHQGGAAPAPPGGASGQIASHSSPERAATSPPAPTSPGGAPVRSAGVASSPRGQPVGPPRAAVEAPQQALSGERGTVSDGRPSPGTVPPRAGPEAAATQARQPGMPAAPGRPALILPPTPGPGSAASPVRQGGSGEPPVPVPETLVRPSPRPASGSEVQAGPPDADVTAFRLGQELARQVEGAVARIQYNQLNSLPQEDPSRQVWQLDLPLRAGDRLETFKLRIAEEGRRSKGGTAASWTVTLTFDLAPLGPVHTRIGLQGETVAGTFWAERPETARLINSRLDELREGFERSGLVVGNLSAHRGPAPRPPEQPASGALLDDTA